MTKIINSIFVDPETKSELKNGERFLSTDQGVQYPIQNSIPNLIFPKKLKFKDEESKMFYEGRAQQYDETLHLTFFTHAENENAFPSIADNGVTTRDERTTPPLSTEAAKNVVSSGKRNVAAGGCDTLTTKELELSLVG